MTKFADMNPPPWETTSTSGRADLKLHPLIREAYKVACLIEDCGGSPELTTASSTAFRLTELLSDYFRASYKVSDGRLRELWKQAGGSVDRKGRAFLEIDLLPAALRKILDGALQAESAPKTGDVK